MERAGAFPTLCPTASCSATGKLVVKGMFDPEDVEMAAACGADAIVVSNHGGRQLDGAMSLIAAVVAAVGSRTKVHVDGGIQSGQDVFEAIAMAPRACAACAPSRR